MNKIVFIMVMLPLIFHSCEDPMEDGPDFDLIENKLLQDSSLSGKDELIRSAMEFYKAEIQNQFSYRIFLSSGKAGGMFLDDIDAQEVDSLRNHLDPSTKIRIRKVTDLQIFDEDWLANNIRHAILSTGNYPWNQQVPDSIFLNYLLPYKMSHEYPQDWWKFLEPYYRDSLTAWSSPSFTAFDATNARWVQQYTTIYPRSLPMWWNYDPQAVTFTKYPSLNEILLLRNGGCYLEAMINVMILRSCGIPATIYEVPFWGSRNGSHAGDAYWSYTEQKLVTRYSWVEYNPEYYVRPAKVIHYTFRYTGSYNENIKPWLNGEKFQIPQMSGNQWYDATANHTKVSDIRFHVPGKEAKQMKLGYIYVMNYGEWVPVDFGYVRGDSLFFTSMGRDVIYRAGFYSRREQKFITRPFLLDRQGEIRYSDPEEDHRITIHAAKINHGRESMVDSGNIYTLQYLDDSGQWQDHESKKCLTDGQLNYDGVPSGAFYSLFSSSDKRHLARIFLANEQGMQLWY